MYVWVVRCLTRHALTVESQGLDSDMDMDSVDGIPTASTEQWAGLAEAERLELNVKAYRSFQDLLSELLEDQQQHLTPSFTDFHKDIHAALLYVTTFSNQMEELMVALEHAVPEQPTGTKGAEASSLFQKKLKGYKVLLELSQWTLRSIRDLRHLSTSGKYQVKARATPVFQTIRVSSRRVVVHDTTK
ncbi:ciliary neurotrophic factor isoform X2 [Ambystoma mexicanum]|uniref:ciliary neurotrophic factor isoform X2 n=1 Tax=Ambystoma mexicanum TaxID=8296 RepID=UPI0037E7CFAF